MQLISEDTVWVFLSGSDEERFLDDISFGIECLIYRGIDPSRILVFVDQASTISVLSAYSFPQKIGYYPTSKLKNILDQINPVQLALIVTGHGCFNGIVASSVITPNALLTITKSVSSLKYALVILGQCYAGIYNFLEAKTFDKTTNEKLSPEICIIGATNLNVSLSISIKISTFPPPFNSFSCNKEWLANIYLLFFMCYVATPVDVDGDNIINVLDSYKMAGIQTNESLHKLKLSLFLESYTLLSDTVSQLVKEATAKELAEKAKKDLIYLLDTILTNQNSWILNANFARKLNL